MSDLVKRYFILDRSGSMNSIVDDTIGGFNAFINSQREDGGTMSLYLFDDKFDVIYEDIDIKDVKELTEETFIPRGSTALYDAIGTVIKKILDNPKSNNKIKNKIVIFTDGYENSSKKYTANHIKDLIEKNTKNGWEFMYIGANQDSILEGSKLGIMADQTLDFDETNICSVMRSASRAISSQARGVYCSLRKASSEE
jgi:hypothetical protein